MYHDKIRVYVEHPIACRDIQYRAPDSRSRFIPENYNLINHFNKTKLIRRLAIIPIITTHYT